MYHPVFFVMAISAFPSAFNTVSFERLLPLSVSSSSMLPSLAVRALKSPPSIRHPSFLSWRFSSIHLSVYDFDVLTPRAILEAGGKFLIGWILSKFPFASSNGTRGQNIDIISIICQSITANRGGQKSVSYLQYAEGAGSPSYITTVLCRPFWRGPIFTPWCFVLILSFHDVVNFEWIFWF